MLRVVKVEKSYFIMSNLANKVVFVTGSGSGIGKATAKMFCKNGARVILNGRNENKLIDAKIEFEKEGYFVDYCVGDVTCIHDCAAIANYIQVNYEAVDVVVANASLSMNGLFENFSSSEFKEIFESNVYSVVNSLFSFLPQLKLTRGSFIIIGSVAGFYGFPTASAYSAGKSAISVLQQCLNAELGKHNIHVGIIHVGFTENDSLKKLASGNGKWSAVPNRPRYLIQSQTKVASEIIRMVQYRTARKTLSITGKITKLIASCMPRILAFFARNHVKRLETNKS